MTTKSIPFLEHFYICKLCWLGGMGVVQTFDLGLNDVEQGIWEIKGLLDERDVTEC